jgi:hypothetical protein
MLMFQTLTRVMRSPADTLKIACEACGRRTVWTRDEAFERLGPGATPYDVRARLRCSACGAARRAHAWI